MLKDLEKAKRPVLSAVKCSLDNSDYDTKKGYLIPKGKMVQSELNVSSVQKISRAIFLLEILLNNLTGGLVNTKRELYYICKGLIRSSSLYKPLDFDSQNESDSVVDFICDMLEVYREEMNCFANDRGGQTYSKNLIVTETLPDKTKAVVDLSSLGNHSFSTQEQASAVSA